MPILGILGLIFVLAKLGGYITWSWWVVLLPLYPLILMAIIGTFILALILLGIIAFPKDVKLTRNKK